MLLISVFLIGMTALAAVSCDRYEDGRPSKAVRKEFARMFPDARDIEWEAENGLWKVSFEIGSGPAKTDYEAWYGVEGNWVRTEKELYPSAVPQAIKDILNLSEYGTALIDDVELVQTPDEEYYHFELNLAGAELYVDVYSDGRVVPSKFDW